MATPLMTLPIEEVRLEPGENVSILSKRLDFWMRELKTIQPDGLNNVKGVGNISKHNVELVVWTGVV